MPIKVLHVIAGMGSGGAESMLMNWYRNIDRNVVQFDFLLRSKENIYADEIERLGGKVYYTAEFPRHYLKNKKQTIKFFKEHASEYSAIHVHCNALLYVNVFNIAKKYGIKTRIIHSHSTKTKNKLFEIFHKANKKKIHKLATNYFACSNEAGKWAFSKKINYQVVNNGIDVERFRYSAAFREETRNELGLEKNFVIGHVGRFLDVKNHIFLVNAFEKICKIRQDAKLLLIGTGPLEDEIKSQVKTRGLSDKVLFLGVRKDVEKLYSTMDVFAFPSKYEGLGIALIEAQTSGLCCIASNRISVESKISDRVKFLDINNSDLWVEEITKAKIDYDREDCYKETIISGFDIKSTVKLLQSYYTGDKND